eukprot:6179583-Pleurochrysis_carterae.AAC.3
MPPRPSGRSAIEAWTKKHGLISPITGHVMPHGYLTPNRVVDAMLRYTAHALAMAMIGCLDGGRYCRCCEARRYGV